MVKLKGRHFMEPSHILCKEEFWAWAYSDLLSNASRGVLAEFMVGKALGCIGAQRVEWDAFDLRLPDQVGIEVKSAAYLQSWQQSKPSTIRFDIARKLSWHSETNQTANEKARPAAAYVFCVFAEQDRAKANPLDTRQWFFLVVPTVDIEFHFGGQKSVGLASLENMGVKRLFFADLHGAVSAALKTN